LAHIKSLPVYGDSTVSTLGNTVSTLGNTVSTLGKILFIKTRKPLPHMGIFMFYLEANL
jgi:hypothetical protein